MNIQNLAMEFQIHENVVAEDAEERFFKVCAFNLAEAGQRKMEATALEVRAHLREQMDIRAAVRFWDKPALDGHVLQLGESSICCSAFEQIPQDAIVGAFVYLLTIGETDIEGESDIMTELYHDIWGTVYVEAAMKELCEDGLFDMAQTLYGNQKVYVSQPFGPGYYGMTMDEGAKLFSLFGEDTAGATQKTNGLLKPEKSCLGLVLIYDRDDIKISHACEKCLGNRSGCQFCDRRNKKDAE